MLPILPITLRMKIKLTYNQIKARKEKLEQDKRDLEHLLSPPKAQRLIEVEADEDMPKKNKGGKVDKKKVNQELEKIEAKLQKWVVLEEQHRLESDIDEMLEGLPDDTEYYKSKIST